MASKNQKTSIKSIVRAPKQDRARVTVEAILESAVQILETEGLDGFKVAALAERSGYGVGTLYQYFENIDGVMLALVEQENERQRQTLLAGFSDLAARGVAQGTRDLVILMLSAFSQRRAAQKAIIDWALSRRDVRSIDGRKHILGTNAGERVAALPEPGVGPFADRYGNVCVVQIVLGSFAHCHLER